MSGSQTRYSRQIALPQVGLEGQEKLSTSRVAIIGLGALGGPVATYLARAGVGQLILFDGDRVDESNLHRQALYSENQISFPKAHAADATLHSINSLLQVQAYDDFFRGTEDQLRELSTAHLILDCTDRFSSRFLVHDSCRELGLDLISASIAGFSGQLHYFQFSKSAPGCLRCMYPDGLDDGCTGSCAQDGILGALAGIFGSLQGLTALEILLGMKGPLPSTTYQWNFADFSSSKFTITPRTGCSCGTPSFLGTELEQQHVAEKPGHGRKVRAPMPLPATWKVIDLRDPHQIQPGDELLFPQGTPVSWDHFDLETRDFDPEIDYFLICEGGVRSLEGAKRLRDRGFSRVWDLEGGVSVLRQKIRGGRG